jgi:hypothetical protein
VRRRTRLWIEDHGLIAWACLTVAIIVVTLVLFAHAYAI